jgi:hypothetical protein
MNVKKILEWGGLAAGAILIIFGIVTIVMGFNGNSVVKSSLQDEYIVGSPDMTPALIKDEATKAGLDMSKIDLPTKSVAGKTINTGDRAREFAKYMRIHTFEATGGLTYAQMGRFLDTNGKPTNDATAAATDPKTHQPVENGLRNLWVTETALTTALNMSFMASQLALFSIVVGFALLLSGIGFTILALAVLGNAFRRETAKATAPKFAPTPA